VRIVVPLIVLSLLLPAVAGAKDRVVVDDAGYVRITRVVLLPPELLLAALYDEGEDDEIENEDLVGRTVLAREGDCTTYRMITKGLVGTMTYDYRTCRTEDGQREDLVASEDFLAYAVEWHINATEGGTEVGFYVRVIPNLKVPMALVRAGQKRSMKGTIDRLVERASRRR
jgi:hypothetical protein